MLRNVVTRTVVNSKQAMVAGVMDDMEEAEENGEEGLNAISKVKRHVVFVLQF